MGAGGEWLFAAWGGLVGGGLFVCRFGFGFSFGFGLWSGRGVEVFEGEDALFDFFADGGVILEELASAVASLSELCAAVVKPAAAAIDDFVFCGEVEEVGFVADAAVAVHVEFGHAEGWSDFVFDDFDSHAHPDGGFAFFELVDAADVESAGAVEFECPAAGCGFGAAEHHADFFADLVDEDDGRASA